MRLPCGSVEDIANTFLRKMDFAVLGCLATEERCCFAPKYFFSFSNKYCDIELLEIMDPPDAVPDYSSEAKEKINQNKQKLKDSGINFQSRMANLLATEDELLNILSNCGGCSTLILDITSLPKRYFCLFIKRVLNMSTFRNVIVTYTQPDSYTMEHLAEDPMSSDHLPGFVAPLSPEPNTLVISVGFESLSIRSSLLEVYREKRKDVKIIMALPRDVLYIERQFRTLRELISKDIQNFGEKNLKIIATWDAERVYETLELWNQETEGLTLAPFGPKPHTLGMALFAIKHDAGIYYTPA